MWGKSLKKATHSGATGHVLLMLLHQPNAGGRPQRERKSNVQSDIESALIGISHLAERLGLSRRTIHRILARGELPSLQIGRRRLVRLSEVRSWLAGCETPPNANATNLSRRFVEQTASR